jgi:hypothetical protein
MSVCRIINLLGIAVLAGSCVKAPQSEIMSWERYRAESRPGHYILELHSDEGKLLYFGAEHTVKLGHPQFTSIENAWLQFHPTIALSEGGDWPLEETREEAISKFGEQGLLRYLAGQDGVQIRSLEPPVEEEVEELLRHYPGEQLKLFYVLRQTVQCRRTSQDTGFDAAIQTSLDVLGKTPGLEGKPRSLTELAESYTRHLGTEHDWREVPKTWVYPTESEVLTNDIARRISGYRNEHMVRLITEYLKDGERVFAVVGVSHVVMQEPALRSALR